MQGDRRGTSVGKLGGVSPARLPRMAGAFLLAGRRLEGNHGEVRWNPETHLPEGPVTSLGSEDMVSHGLDVPETPFQRARRSERVVPAILQASSTASTALLMAWAIAS